VLWHAHALVCPPLLHRPSHSFPHTLSLISAATPTLRTAFRPRLAVLPKLCSDPGCRSNPIAHRVRRKRQPLPPSLLIENASDLDPAPPMQSAPRRFRSRLATIREVTRHGQISRPGTARVDCGCFVPLLLSQPAAQARSLRRIPDSSYSIRKTRIGSSRDARHAGTMQASAAEAISNAATAANTAGSSGWVS
jgi:hypothetical protein